MIWLLILTFISGFMVGGAATILLFLWFKATD